MTDTEREALCKRIDELCAEVERLHADQAHWELGNCPQCPNVASLQEALEQNAKLRELADGAMNESDRLTHDAAALQIENAKLRELVHGLNHCTTWANEDGKDCWSCTLWHEKNCTAEDIERELGIEVVK